MKENQRKCCKCGNSVAKDPTIKLYRFPKPGVRNILRCELWSKFIAPEGSWASQDFQNKLNSNHTMICSNHFEEKCFINLAEKKLFLDAIPTLEIINKTTETIGNPVCNEAPNQETPKLINSMDEDGKDYFQDVTNMPVASTSRQIISIEENQNVISTDTTANTLLKEASRKDETEPSTTISIDVTNMPVASTSRQVISIKEKQNVASAGNEKTKRLYRRCRSYMKKICRLRSSIKQMKIKQKLNVLKDDIHIEKLSEKLTPAFALLLQGQIRNFKRKPKGHRWTENERITALRIYKRSPTCYRLLRRLFSLPAPSTLKKFLGRFNLTVGVNKNIFDLLNNFVKEKHDYENNFVLMFDEISIRKNLYYNPKEDIIEGFQDHGNHGRTSEEATYALVFMIAGIRLSVKQPVAFYLSGSHVTADRLSVIIKEIVIECFQAGINIQCLVCDMDGVNVRAYKILGASESNPEIEINNKKIITMFDTPHLLKCFRNLFLKYNIKCAFDINTPSEMRGIAKWSHIEQFHEVDIIDPLFVYGHSLCASHLQPNSKQKMKVSLAAQVLSHSVASGIYGRIAQGALTSEALITSIMIDKMDKLFDLVNSNSPDLKKSKPYFTNMSDRSPHKEFFQCMKRFFSTLQFINCKRDPPSRIGWIWTLTAIEAVWNKIRCDNIESMSTRRLQQDPLENFFSTIRSNCGSNYNPTVGQFKAAIKTSMLSKLPIIGQGNCESDTNEAILDNFKKLLTSTNSNVPNEDNYTPPPVPSEQIDESSLFHSIDDENVDITATAYVCGFILKNMDIKCNICEDIFKARDEEDIHMFMTFKEYTDTQKRLKYASRPFVENVDECGRIIFNFLSKNGHENNLKSNVITQVKGQMSFNFLKKCKDHYDDNLNFIIKCVFHIVIKRFCTLRNRTYVEQANKAALRNKMNILKHI